MSALNAVTEELLILTKTYPSPSAKYRECSCVAAINRDGELRRLFPVPYRFLSDESQFQKWEWIRAKVSKTTKDQRPESRRIDADSIELLGQKIETGGDWFERKQIISKQVVDDFEMLEKRREREGNTLGIIRPKAISEFQINAARYPTWTKEEQEKLIQDGLFDTAEMRDRIALQKVPYDYYYRYISGESVQTHKIVDWEAGALYWRCIARYGRDGWMEKFRLKFGTEFLKKDLFFLMGTIHRFPNRWLIVGLIYPPKQRPAPPRPASEQLGLGLAL